MAVIACPATVIDAPIERVWSLLIEPRRWAAWSDAHFTAAVPAGPPHAGQRWRFVGLGRRWPITMTVTSLSTEPYRLGLEIAIPLGIHNAEHITLARLPADRTRVQFN